MKANLKKGDALYFSHGFSIVYKDQTGVIPPADVDVILVAPKGSAQVCGVISLQAAALMPVSQSSGFYRTCDRTDPGARNRDRAGYLFPTTFQNEVYSDLTGERGILIGALSGVMEAQYNVLRKNGHTPSEAFNETVEELTQSLIRLVGENGMDSCTPIAPQQPSAGRWIGIRASVRRWNRFLKIFTTVL